ncbi:MAG: CBS domain-containing protein [Methylococcales symbiont of Iophon sp. n. MRB-2018]|nr:MAG: CBS domain-containing protein [Methylococcales symbiont of Iophon sp. n. MRB-2018]KAF3979843.1 MAG: CBS domain-containing protein [Methylococcales symbiont of Iophon sp. n. MRB-2018]
MLAKITIANYMTSHIMTLKQDADVSVAIKQLLDHKITSAPVLDSSGKFIGMFSEKDCMKVVLETSYNQGMSGIVSDYMSKDLSSVVATASIVDLAEKFQHSNVRSYPVFDGNNLIGIVSRTDVLKALVSI